MADPFVAEIRIFPFNYAPKGWTWCNGQLMPISQNTALFSLLGTTYGGNGESTFGIPNLMGSAPMHPGQGSGLSDRDLGQEGGSQTVTLIETEMPAHSHAMRADASDLANAKIPSPTASFAISSEGTLYQDTANTMLAPQALAPAGGDQPHNNMQPFLTLYFNIALQGVFPPRG